MAKKLGWWLVALVAVVIPCLASAQEESVYEAKNGEGTVNEAGIPVGAFLFSPSLELIYERKDNIFLTETDKVHDSVYVVRPRLMLELPVAENYFRVVYMPQYRNYKDFNFTEHWSHFLDFQAHVDTPSGFELKLDNRLVRGTLETAEFDPGRENPIGLSPFFKDRAQVTLGYAVSETDFLGADINYTTVRFDDQNTTFYDYDTFEGGLLYRRAMSPLMNMTAGVGGSHNSVSDTDSFRGYDGWYARAGVDGEFTQNLSGNFRLGYEKQRHDKDLDGRRQEFSGLTIDSSIKYSAMEGSSLELELGRAAYLSNFEGNGFYTSEKIGLNFDTMIVGQLFGTAGFTFQRNDYDRANAGERKRRDDLKRATLGIGYHFTDIISARGNWRYENRDSNLSGFDYKANVFLVNLIFGY